MVVQWIVSLSCEAGSAGSNPVHSMSDSFFFFVPVKCKLPGGREGEEVKKEKEEGEKKKEQGYVNLRQAVPPAGSMNPEVV